MATASKSSSSAKVSAPVAAKAAAKPVSAPVAAKSTPNANGSNASFVASAAAADRANASHFTISGAAKGGGDLTVTAAQYQAALAKATPAQRAALEANSQGYPFDPNSLESEGMGRDDAEFINSSSFYAGGGGSSAQAQDENAVVNKADVAKVGSVLGKAQNAQALARAFGVDSALFTSGKLTIGKLANGKYSAIDSATGRPVGNGVTQAQISASQKMANVPTVTTAGVDKLATQKMTDANTAAAGAKSEAAGAQALSDYGIQTAPGKTVTQGNAGAAGSGNVNWAKINAAVAKGLETNEAKTEDSITMQANRLEASGRTEDAQKLREILTKSKELVKKQKADANKDGALANVDDEEQRKAIMEQQDVSQRENSEKQDNFDATRKELESQQDEFVAKINPMYAEQWGDIRNIQSQVDQWRSENRKLLDENYALNKEYLSKAEAMDSAAATNRLGALGASEEILRNSLNQVANDPNRMASRIKVQEQYMNGINSAIEKVNAMYQSIIARKDSLTDDERTFAEGLKNYAQTLEKEKAAITDEGTKAKFEPVKAAVATQVATTSEKATSQKKNEEDMARYKDGDLQMRQSMLQDKLYTLIPNLRGRIPESELRRIANRNGSLSEDLQALSSYATTAEDKQKLAELGRASGAAASASAAPAAAAKAVDVSKAIGTKDAATGKVLSPADLAQKYGYSKLKEQEDNVTDPAKKAILQQAIAIAEKDANVRGRGFDADGMEKLKADPAASSDYTRLKKLVSDYTTLSGPELNGSKAYATYQDILKLAQESQDMRVRNQARAAAASLEKYSSANNRDRPGAAFNLGPIPKK